VKRWEAWVNHLGWAVVAASGLLYGILKYFVRGTDPDSRLAVPWQPSVLAIHVLAAPVAVFALGLVFRRHALTRLAMGQREGRPTGRALTWLAIPLAATGYLIPVLTGNAARHWTGWIHSAIGLVFAVGYLFHPKSSLLPGDSPESPPEP